MATQQLQLVCDSSTVANYKAWAKPISDWFRSCGYTNTSDTGQLNGSGGGNWAGVVSVPGAGAFYYEVFQSNDAYTQFFVRVDYGNSSGTNLPSLHFTIGTGTNGSGTITGVVTSSPVGSYWPLVISSVPSASTQYECDFSGDSTNSRIGIMMWRNSPSANNSQWVFAIERSLNSSGTPTNAYVTFYGLGYGNGGITGKQQSIGLGGNPIGPALPSRGETTSYSGWNSRLVSYNYQGSSGVAGSAPFDNVSPSYGVNDYPSTMVAVGWQTDFAEGATVVLSVYGSSRTYMGSKNGNFLGALPGTQSNSIVFMRYD